MISLSRFILAIVILYSAVAVGQPRTDIKPAAIRLSARLFAAPEEHIYAFDTTIYSMDRRTDNAGHMPRFAHSLAADLSPAYTGTWTVLPGGDRVWRVSISSPGALGLIPCFDSFFLPQGATLHAYTPDHSEVLGAFTTSNNPHDGRYNIGLIHGERCIIEYDEPAAVAGRGRLHISEIGHAYRMVPGRKQDPDFGTSGTCEVNVKCPEGDNWQTQKNAVVRIMVKTGQDYGWCSGSLINNVNQDCTPYVLSADHCYQDERNNWADPSAADLSDWMFYFQYESPSCQNPATEGTLGNHYMTGCTFVAASLDDGGSTGSDFSLLRLNSTPPVSFMPYYEGWNNINTSSPNGVGIHHPEADIKKISTYDDPLTSTSYGGTVPGTHWQIQWDATISGHGVTEPGSSGSPLFDPSAYVVGTLTGGQSACSTTSGNDVYGKFSYHWASNGLTSNKRLQNWLDPGNTGAQTLNGVYGPCAATQPLDAAITAIMPTGTQCTNAITISCTLSNYGSTQLTSDSVTFNIDGADQVVLWAGTLASLQSTTVSLAAQNFANGTHTITVSSAAPNGGVDGNSANNSLDSTFTVVPAAGVYTYYLQTGDRGSEVNWELADATDNVLYSGGPYTDNASGQVIDQQWCLPAGCYTYTLFNSAGNGLQGRSLDGTFYIRNSMGDTIEHLRTVDFGTIDTATFCQSASLGINAVVASTAAITIYPNPSSGIYTVSHADHVTAITVTDALGRLVLIQSMHSQAAVQIDMRSEESGVYFFRCASDQGVDVRKVILQRR